jgi:hypothetical protein
MPSINYFLIILNLLVDSFLLDSAVQEKSKVLFRPLHVFKIYRGTTLFKAYHKIPFQSATSILGHSHNACHNGLGEVAAFLRLFAKTVTVYTSPIAGTC